MEVVRSFKTWLCCYQLFFSIMMKTIIYYYSIMSCIDSTIRIAERLIVHCLALLPFRLLCKYCVLHSLYLFHVLVKRLVLIMAKISPSYCMILIWKLNENCRFKTFFSFIYLFQTNSSFRVILLTRFSEWFIIMFFSWVDRWLLSWYIWNVSTSSFRTLSLVGK